jgi:exonuclease III
VKEEFSPLDAKADWLGESTSPSTEDLCREGRLICTDHGSFVLLNVYVPNAGDHDEGRPRLDFKMRYLKALEQTCKLYSVASSNLYFFSERYCRPTPQQGVLCPDSVVLL